MLMILVIDDDISVLGVIKRALTKSGYHVETAAGGREGIQKFDSVLFDIVITDIMMPDMDGNAVVRHIRRSGRKYTPVIGISGTPCSFDAHDHDIILQKPVSIKTLEKIVQNFCIQSERLFRVV